MAPARRASERPIAIACLRLLTLRPERPLRNVPVLRSCIALLTFELALRPYFAAMIRSSTSNSIVATNVVKHRSVTERQPGLCLRSGNTDALETRARPPHRAHALRVGSARASWSHAEGHWYRQGKTQYDRLTSPNGALSSDSGHCRGGVGMSKTGTVWLSLTVAVGAAIATATAQTSVQTSTPPDSPSLVQRADDITAGKLVQSPQGETIGTVKALVPEAPAHGLPD